MGGAFFLGMAERLKKVRKKHAISAEALGLCPWFEKTQAQKECKVPYPRTAEVNILHEISLLEIFPPFLAKDWVRCSLCESFE